jgi:hypothetical protein
LVNYLLFLQLHVGVKIVLEIMILQLTTIPGYSLESYFT